MNFETGFFSSTVINKVSSLAHKSVVQSEFEKTLFFSAVICKKTHKTSLPNEQRALACSREEKSLL